MRGMLFLKLPRNGDLAFDHTYSAPLIEDPRRVLKVTN